MSVPLATKSMEAEPVDDLPRGKGWLYEPKYDGFRCLAFRDGAKIDLSAGYPIVVPFIAHAYLHRRWAQN